MTKKLFIFAILLLGGIPAFAQVDTAWVRIYEGPMGYNNRAYAIAVDGSANVYVTGYSAGSGTGYDYATIKYYPNGDTAWVRRYDGPASSRDEALAITVDGSGNVYVTGKSRGSGTYDDYATIKYYPNGDTAWVRRYNGTGDSTDCAYAIAVDRSGNVYVTGRSWGTSGADYDYVTIKYYPNGNTAWVKRFNDLANYWDSAYDVATDDSGNVYVTGRANWGNSDCTTIRYYRSGNTAWVRRYNGAGNSEDAAFAVALDGSGNIYVTGCCHTYWGVDYATIKYDSSGTELWVRTYDGPGEDYDIARDIAVDGSGNVYVTGESWGSGTRSDYATIKYSAYGGTAWVRRYDGPGHLEDSSRAVAVDGSGNVYVTGGSRGSNAYWHYATIKYDPSGDIAWVQRYEGSGSSYNRAFAMATDDSGNVYVTGGSGNYYATIKYVQNANGTIAGTVKDATTQEYLEDVLVEALQNDVVQGNDNTNSGGQYMIANLIPGTYDTRASKTGFETQTIPGQTVISGGTITVDFQLTPLPALGAIVGTVTDAITHESLEGVLVEALQDAQVIDSDYSDANGEYEIADLQPGDYDVRASKFGYETQTQYGVTVEENQTTIVDFELVPLATGDVSGFVFDGLTQSGLGEVLVEFQQNSQTLYSTSSEAGTGLYELWGISVGDYIVRYSKDGYVTEHVSVSIEAGWNILPSIYLDPGQILFVDHFTGSSSPLWSTLHGDCDWQVVNNTYTTSLVGTSLLCKKAVLNQDWANYVFEVDVKGNAGADKVVLFRIQDDFNSYDINVRSDWEGKDEILFNRLEDGVTNTLAIVEYPSENGRWYHLKIACVDETFTIFVDGEQVIQYTDLDNPIYSGGIGLACWTGGANECDIAFDNVQVLDIFPRFVFESVDGDQLGDEVTLAGGLEYWNGTPHVPSSGYCGLENPMKEMTEMVPVGSDGHFNHVASPVGGADEVGFFILNFGVSTGYGIVRKRVSIGISDPDPLDDLPIYYDVETGPLEEPHTPQTDIISKKRGVTIRHPFWMIEDLAVGFFKQVKPALKSGMKRATESSTGKLLVSGFETARDNCENGHNLGSCTGALGIALELGYTSVMNAVIAPFHDFVDDVFPPEQQETAHFIVDAEFFVLGIVSIAAGNPEGAFNILNNISTWVNIAPKYINIVEEYIPVPGNSLNSLEEQPYFALLVVDQEDNVFVVGVYPRLPNICTVRGFSPIELRVTDAQGRVIDKNGSEIPGGSYTLVDSDIDGDSEVIVSFPVDSVGDINIEVFPDSAAQPTDTFSVTVDNTYFSETLILADQVEISQIPPEGYQVELFENLPPDTFSLQSPSDSSIVSLPFSLSWTQTVDPNPGHSVSYELYLSKNLDFSDSVFIDSLSDTTGTVDSAILGDHYGYNYWKIKAHDAWGAGTWSNQVFVVYIKVENPGDANGDGIINSADVVYLINYLFKGGPPPVPLEAGDVNCDGVINSADVVYLINYLFKGGPSPVGC